MTSASVNIASPLVEQAAARPHTLALIEPHGTGPDGPAWYRHLTFAELDAESDRLARGLSALGVCCGTRTALMVPPSLEFYALTFALFKLGAVVVLIDPGMGIQNLGICLGEAAPEVFIGVPKAHVARVLFGWARASIRIRVWVGPQLFWGGSTLARVRALGAGRGTVLAPTTPDEVAAILFTSGSTGVAKGVVYSHALFAAQVESLRRLYGIEPGEIDLPTFPLFGLYAPALGLTAVLPEMDATRPAHVDPRKIIHAIEHFRVTNLFGSPALIRRVGGYTAGGKIHLPTLRRVISAGAPVPASVIARFCELLPVGVQVHTPYGATESLPVSSIGSDEILGETGKRTSEGAGVCVGRPVEGMTVRVIRISDEPIPRWNADLEVPAGEVGEIVVKGPVVTRSYHARPESTALAKIEDPTGGFWHRMGDLGYLDDRGRIWFCGRRSQRVVTPEGTLFTIPCEGVFNAQPGVRRTALVGVPREGKTVPVLCVECEPGADETAVRRGLLELGERYPHTRRIREILFHPGFPVDIRHNAKIFREKLAAWAASASVAS